MKKLSIKNCFYVGKILQILLQIIRGKKIILNLSCEVTQSILQQIRDVLWDDRRLSFLRKEWRQNWIFFSYENMVGKELKMWWDNCITSKLVARVFWEFLTILFILYTHTKLEQNLRNGLSFVINFGNLALSHDEQISLNFSCELFESVGFTQQIFNWKSIEIMFFYIL